MKNLNAISDFINLKQPLVSKNIFNYMNFYLGEWDMDEPYPEFENLLGLDALRAIDVWLEITGLPMSAFMLLCRYHETGYSKSSTGYSYYNKGLFAEGKDYLLECLDASIFAYHTRIEETKIHVEIDVFIEDIVDDRQNFILLLFSMIESLYNQTKAFKVMEDEEDEEISPVLPFADFVKVFSRNEKTRKI